jgi:hypothetical protein
LNGGFLVLRRGSALWGVANAAVSRLLRRGGGFRVTAAGGELSADEVLGVVGELAVRPPGRAVERFWPEAAAGLAVFSGRPLVVIDPGRPPAALRPLAGEAEGDKG